MATDSTQVDPSLIALVDAAWDRPAFQEGFTQLSRALVTMLPRQAMWDAMSSSMLPFVQTLAPADRERVNQLLDEAYQAATSARQEPDEEQVAALADTVREFTSSQAGFIPRNRQKQAFVYFCGLLALLTLMQSSFQSETADAVLGELSEMLPLTAPVMYAAHKAWDRYGRRPEDEDDADGQEDDGN